MFKDCENIIEIDLSCFDTRNVTDMKMMFFRCIHLKEIDLTNFNTENVISMESMFNECYQLKHLNISSFNTKKVGKDKLPKTAAQYEIDFDKLPDLFKALSL